MKRILLATALLTALCASAQDPRERVYNYEVLKPSHEIKPQVEGYASKRVCEKFGRGLTARLSEDGKGIYLGWRLLNSDPQEAGFHLYRRANGRVKRLTSRPVTRTTDFIDRHPVEGPAEYQVVPAGIHPNEAASPWVAADFRILRQAPRYAAFRTQGDAGKLGIGDLDGDGTFEFIVRTPATGVDPGVQGRHFDSVYTIAAYRRDDAAARPHLSQLPRRAQSGVSPIARSIVLFRRMTKSKRIVFQSFHSCRAERKSLILNIGSLGGVSPQAQTETPRTAADDEP